MRRDINWKTKREDGTWYEVRVTPFGGKFRFQFREKGASAWDYQRRPSREDVEQLVDVVARRHQRQLAKDSELAEAKQLLQTL